MIKSFLDKDTAAAFLGQRVKRFGSDWQSVARRKLAMLNAACTIDDLRVPPGNRLEKLVGTREGQWSVRINNQWRVCFSWRDGHAWDVEITDYH